MLNLLKVNNLSLDSTGEKSQEKIRIDTEVITE